jgi:histidinol-phosphate/aromatic aminotransferase/cobyric acid decarboxylase-like protein
VLARAPAAHRPGSGIAFGAGNAGQPARVLFPTPTFNQYEALARAYGAEPAQVPLDDDFRPDERRFLAAIQRLSPALAFFACPNNPTGNRFDADAANKTGGGADHDRGNRRNRRIPSLRAR